MKAKLLFLFSVFVLVLLSEAAHAQVFGNTGTSIVLPEGDAVYNPNNDTYYRLMRFEGQPPYSWRHGRKMATSFRHEGRDGFLAQIKDTDTHYFIVSAMPLLQEKAAWVALNVLCEEGGSGYWVDGSSLAQQSFRAWSANAPFVIRSRCKGSKDILPVFYKNSDIGVRWHIGQQRMNQPYILVEYPNQEAADARRAAELDFAARRQNR